MKKYLNKQVVSLLLSGALVSSVAPSVVNATNYEEEAISYNYNYDENNESKMHFMNGVFSTVVDGKPVYVYLGNGKINEYLPKYRALDLIEENYDKVYVYSKTVNNPNYIPGVSDYSEKKITVYAISEKSYVSGWTRVNLNNIDLDEMIATSIELGDFLLKCVDLSTYKNSMLGFAYIDINKDGVNDELFYFANNKVNRLMSKDNAIKFGNENYKNYYFHSKSVLNPDYVSGKNSKYIKIYALSDKAYVVGWNRISKSSLPSDAKVGSNPEYMEAVISLYSSKIYKTIQIPSFPNIPTVPDDNKSMLKEDALNYAYINYSSFCIMTRTITNSRGNEIVMYSFSFSPNVEGWEIIGNDFIPENASIFLNINYANDYEYQVKSGTVKGLR